MPNISTESKGSILVGLCVYLTDETEGDKIKCILNSDIHVFI